MVSGRIAVLPHSTVIVGIHMVFCRKDPEECCIPRGIPELSPNPSCRRIGSPPDPHSRYARSTPLTRIYLIGVELIETVGHLPAGVVVVGTAVGFDEGVVVVTLAQPAATMKQKTAKIARITMDVFFTENPPVNCIFLLMINLRLSANKYADLIRSDVPRCCR